MKLLRELYRIHSPSGQEQEIQAFIRAYLKAIGVSYNVDHENQTYSLKNTDKPLVIAHADQVRHKAITQVFETQDLIYGNGNIGADDKNGVWVILQLLKEDKSLNFIFSNNEEVGGDIQSLLSNNSKNLKNIPYGLIFDRKGGSDIIGESNDYCTKKFQDRLESLGFGYKATIGSLSDCDSLKDYMNCVNLSVGYYKAHTTQEYTVKSELKDCLNFARGILESLEGEVFEVDVGYLEDLEEWGSDYSTCNSCGTWLESYDAVWLADRLVCGHCGHALEN